jgi:hypothetical protein
VPCTIDPDAAEASEPSAEPVNVVPDTDVTRKMSRTVPAALRMVTENVPAVGNPVALETEMEPEPAVYGAARVVVARFPSCSIYSSSIVAMRPSASR